MPDISAEVLAQLGRMNDKLDAIREDVSDTKADTRERLAALEAMKAFQIPALEAAVSSNDERLRSLEKLANTLTRLDSMDAKVLLVEQKAEGRAKIEYVIDIDKRLQKIEQTVASEGLLNKSKFNLLSWVGGVLTTGGMSVILKLLFHF